MTISTADYEAYLLASVLVLTCISGVRAWRPKTSSKISVSETISNFSIYLIGRLTVAAVGFKFNFYLLSVVADMRWWSMDINIYSVVALFFLSDLTYYWKHRHHHEWSLLWANHSVHHSSNEYNFSTSLRLSWFAMYFNFYYLFPLILLGYSAPLVLITHQWIKSYQILLHTDLVGTLGPLEKIFNTPSHHRVHHGTNPQYLNKNFAGIFIFWDKIFGSFAKEEAPVNYGVLSPVNSKNPILVNVRPWQELIKSQRNTSRNFTKIRN